MNWRPMPSGTGLDLFGKAFPARAIHVIPSDTVRSLLRRGGVFKARHEARLAKKLSGAAVPVSEA